MNLQKPLLICVVGPTAVGKTALAIEMAKLLRTEIVSADSRQFYREMHLGTAKPSEEELKMVKHHFINSHSIHEDYSAGRYEEDVITLLQKLFTKTQCVLLVGGSGMYVNAVCDGFDQMPGISHEVRDALNDEFRSEGLEPLLDELSNEDPGYYDQVDKQNHQRVIRALEVIRSTGKPFSSFRKGRKQTIRDFNILKVGLQMDRTTLNERIDQRMDRMINEGLFEEAERLYAFRKLNALQTVGYKEIFAFIDGAYDRAEAVRLLKRNTRRYAKRQMTWFMADEQIRWFDSSATAEEILISLQLA